MAEIVQPTPKNIAETLLAELPRMADVQIIARPERLHDADAPDDMMTTPHIVAIPNGLTRHDLTADWQKAQATLQPYRRTGTARMLDLASLIAWANRFKGPDSVLFADIGAKPSLTCIADYHAGGAPVSSPTARDPTASHCRHRAAYAFPVSREWETWTGVSGTPLTMPQFGEFIEANAKDLLNPTPNILRPTYQDKAEPWELAMIAVAEQLGGRFGTYAVLQQLAKQFAVNEVNNIVTSNNRDSGEQVLQFLNEHKDPDGAPISIPNLFMIAVPVFDGDAAYRLAVRFRYRKFGASIAFIMSLHNPDVVFRDAVKLAITTATTETALPVLAGFPEV
jgi:hypothetical protein